MMLNKTNILIALKDDSNYSIYTQKKMLGRHLYYTIHLEQMDTMSVLLR